MLQDFAGELTLEKLGAINGPSSHHEKAGFSQRF